MAIYNPFYTREYHGEYDLVSVGRLDLEEGGTIPDCQLAVTTWGELNEAIWSDPGWNGGEYTSNEDVADGLKRHAHLWGTMGLSTEFWKQEIWRALEFESMEQFLEDFLEPYFTVMDPNDLLTMAWKWQRGDVARNTGGDLSAALVRISAKTFVMPIDEDMFFPPRDCKAEQEKIPGSELRVVEDIAGHLGLFATAPTYMPQIDGHLGDLLATEV